MSGKRAKQKRKENLRGLRLWHYTTDHHFGKISATGAIIPTEVNIEKNEKPAVWLSSNSDWEKTVTKVLSYNDGTTTDSLDRDGLFKFGIIPMRIEVDVFKIKSISAACSWVRSFSSFAIHNLSNCESSRSAADLIRFLLLSKTS